MKTRFLLSCRFPRSERSASLWIRLCSLVFIGLLVAAQLLYAGTTGKLAGRVRDSETKEPLVGVNVFVEGTYLGAVTDGDGYYFINNIPPGQYTVIASMVGFKRTITRNVVIKIDLTTRLDISLTSTVLQLGQEVVVQAVRPMVQKDLTSTSATVSSEEMKMMPVENLNQVINLQAGVVGGHFRGGRRNEVAYLVDGVSVTDAFSGSLGLEIENSSIREMEVISGTFNAEYGQAMSGIVNIVTQDGTSHFRAMASAYGGNYFTPHTDLFQNLDKLNNIRSKDLQFNLSGPVLVLEDLTFFLTARYFHDEGHLYGKRVYNITDDVPYFPDPLDQSTWIARNTGDGAYVPMNPYTKYSFNGKLTYSFPSLKISYSYFWDDNENKYYNHGFSWTPDGILNHYRTNNVHSLQVTHVPSQSTFQSLKFAYNDHDYRGYLYEDPFDLRYVDPRRGIAVSNYTFRSGGNDGSRYARSTRTFIAQWSLNSQLSKEHKIGLGAEARLHRIFNHGWEIYNLTEGQVDSLRNPIFTLGYRSLGSFGNQAYTKYPLEISAYLQDKMEYDIMIINAGVRFDYFNPRSSMPTDLRNPANNPNFPEAGQLTQGKTTVQISPRLGASFPITDQGAIHFSYGHFFQIPDFGNLYYNSDFLVRPGGSLSSITGNPDLKPQRTVMYEIGLQQVLFPNVSVDFTVYYRDIRNLLGMEIINTYEGFKYARFINRDYGNVRGFIVSVDKRFADFFSAQADYTYQIAEGNASDPYAVYNDNQTDPPIESEKKVVPLDWDQRSTLNLALNVGTPGDWTVGLVFQYGSGWPYTEDARISQGVRFENGGKRPATYNVDLKADKVLMLGDYRVNLFLLVYNLLDIKNEYGVYASTGRATSDLNTKYAGEIIGLNTIEQFVKNPSMYSTPRQLRFGLSLGF
ncbi:MAG TPA: TonB-dependent receptor [Bacteroidetes bacterium]|nr:TonB-dependent receptor [Bacteroidota bacterium]